MTDTTMTQESIPTWQQYLELCKPKVVLLIVFTAVVGMLLSTPGMVPLDIFIFGNLGIGLAAASGAAINHWVDQKIDAEMERTQGRPLPNGGMSSRSALFFALSLTVISMVILTTLVNPLTAILTFFCVIGYAVIYTMFLKRSTPHNIVLGGAAGAAPPILGWAAVTGEVHTESLLLFLIIFIWTPPHFWALAIRRRDDYAKVDVPMLPVTHGIPFTKLQVLLYSIMLLAVTLIPFAIQMSGLIYLAGAVALGIGFIYHAYKLYLCEGDEHAMKTFAYSIFYLTALFGFLLVDHYARIAIRIFM
ncbi:protoheme IX farnesyltransferase [Gammaproteobacteria bacterium 45_16_T64]|nr:protoheme IX farnesyltransferase [Gammaproteobacteria bacterium 45_16_T64]